jgi:hypothetical protein
MKTGSGLLAQLERCGLSAKLADDHVEISEDASGSRKTRREITRAFHARDHAQLQEANTALRWLTSEPGDLFKVGEAVDLIDHETGEVLVTGKPGAVLAMPGLVVAWKMGDQFDAPEPEDDLGLIAMGLAALPGQAFRVAYVTLKGDEVFPRRSPVFEVDTHAALFDRIKTAVSQPRVACPGDWCGSCRQNIHCPSWKARSTLAMTVFTKETKVSGDEEPKDMVIPTLEITDENAGELALRIRAIEKACELAIEQLKAFVRRGGRCSANGKEYAAGSCDGRKTADVKALEADGLTKYIKQGNPFETWRWKKSSAPKLTRKQPAQIEAVATEEGK